ncbi:MAG: DMT family transporter [Candidatus Levyibacteriota bacterium]
MAIIAAITYGFFPVFSHYFVITIDPLLFGGITMLVGSLPLLWYLWVKNEIREIYHKKYLFYLLGVAISSGIGMSFFFTGASLTSGINTSLLLQLEPIYSIILSSIFLREIIGRGQVIGTLLMVLGAGVVVSKGISGINLGDIFILIALLFFQTSHLFAKKVLPKLKNTNIVPAARLFYGGLLVTGIALSIHHAAYKELFSSKNDTAMLLFGLYTFLDMFLAYQALKRLALAKVTAIMPFSVIVAFSAAILFLKEVPTLQQYIGVILIGGGLIFLSVVHFKGEGEKSVF